MGSKLGATHKEKLLESETINSTTYSSIVDIDGAEHGYAVQVIWVNGVGVNMTLSIETSLNGTDWSEIPSTVGSITAAGDNVMYDIANTYVQYARVKILVTAGTADFTVLYSGKRRH